MCARLVRRFDMANYYARERTAGGPRIVARVGAGAARNGGEQGTATKRTASQKVSSEKAVYDCALFKNRQIRQ